GVERQTVLGHDQAQVGGRAAEVADAVEDDQDRLGGRGGAGPARGGVAGPPGGGGAAGEQDGQQNSTEGAHGAGALASGDRRALPLYRGGPGPRPGRDREFAGQRPAGSALPAHRERVSALAPLRHTPLRWEAIGRASRRLPQPGAGLTEADVTRGCGAV